MKFMVKGVCYICLMLALSPFNALAHEQEQLTDSEIARAIELEENAVTARTAGFRDAVSVRDALNNITTGPEYITSVQAMPRASESVPLIAEVSRYQYAGGLTVHTYVDLDSGKILSVTPYAHYPTPLSDEELERARVIAFEQVPAVTAAVAAEHGSNLDVSALTRVVSSKSHPDFGHRLAVLHFQSLSGSTFNLPPVHVNLSTGKAYVK